MPRITVSLAIAFLAATLGQAWPADAAPGDYRLLTGTIVWPAQVSADSTVVIQSDDGVMHFAELAPAEALVSARAGDRVSIIGREGFQPTQILFGQLAHRDTTAAALPALPLAIAITPVTEVSESPDIVLGTVESVTGRSLRLINRYGHRIEVDVAAIDPGLRADVHPGDTVRVYAPTRISGLPIAAGIVVEHTAGPAALPRQ